MTRILSPTLNDFEIKQKLYEIKPKSSSKHAKPSCWKFEKRKLGFLKAVSETRVLKPKNKKSTRVKCTMRIADTEYIDNLCIIE